MRIVRGKVVIAIGICALACRGEPATSTIEIPDPVFAPADAAIDTPIDAALPDAAIIDVSGCRRDADDVCGNGLDDNCDGATDEGCPCELGSVQSCFAGTPGQHDVGACRDGQQRCVGEPGRWGTCSGGIAPSAERCDGLDDDCDGSGDPSSCGPALACPGPGAMPDAVPLQHYMIDGQRFFAGEVMRWAWTVTGGPCDQLFTSQGKPTSFLLEGADTSRLTLTARQVGDYTVRLSITTADVTFECEFIVHVAGKGVRFELCWDTSGLADLDLHVHRRGPAPRWFDEKDDCFYANCSFDSLTRVDWGYPQSPARSCKMNADPAETAGCPNPRLETDNVYDDGKAENTNVDLPAHDSTYRMMANYFGGGDVTRPMANVYCEGRLVASFGQPPDLVPRFHIGGGDGDGSMWRIADVTTQIDASGVTRCDVVRLRPPGMTTGYDVSDGDLRF